MIEAAELVRRIGCVGLVLHLSLSVCPQQVTTSLHCGVPTSTLDARIFIYLLYYNNNILLYIYCVGERGCACSGPCVKVKRTTCGSLLFPSTMWVSGVKPWLSGSAASTEPLSHLVISPCTLGIVRQTGYPHVGRNLCRISVQVST